MADHLQEERIYREIRSRLLRRNEQSDQLFTRTKMEMLREERPLQRIRRDSKSLKVVGLKQKESKAIKLPSFDELQETIEQPQQPLMYRTLQFQHNWGGMPVKPTSQWVPSGSVSPKLRSPRKSSVERPGSPELIRLLPPKFQPDRGSILNKSNLFLVPYLKNKIRVINSDFNVACVGDIPISYNYPPPPSRKQSPMQPQRKRPTIPAVPIFQRPMRRVSLDSIKEIGPW